MDKINYQKELDAILSSIAKTAEPNSKPSLLLHACCAPCSSYVLEYLLNFFKITVFYYNPNIHPQAEYNRRLTELKNFLPAFSSEKTSEKIRLIEEPYDTQDFFNATNVENEPQLKTEAEKGERCRRCYLFRMKKAYQFACQNNFDWFTTTLSISPFKDAQKINTIGKSLELENAANFQAKTKFLTSDFKKKGGFKRSLELSRKFGLYRQDYCGCVFSKQNMNKTGKQDDN
ncbi:MAG: epoxyqueuosine reductase QueH [Treponema sp.]